MLSDIFEGSQYFKQNFCLSYDPVTNLTQVLQNFNKMESNLKVMPPINNTMKVEQPQQNSRQGVVNFPGRNNHTKQKHHPIGNDHEDIVNNLRFKPHNGNKFYNPTIEMNGGLSATQQSRISTIKVYEQNGHFEAKLPERLTFGPHDFPSDLGKVGKEQNPEQILPITHKKKEKSKSVVRINDVDKKKSKVYQIMRKELGINDEQLESLRPDTINHELERFARRKGLEYLQENHENIKRSNTEGSHPRKQKAEKINSERKQNKKGEEKPKYINYLPQVLPKINRKNSSKKTIFSEKNKCSRQKQLPKKLTKKQAKLLALNDQEQILGKIVYDKVQDYFKLSQKKIDYFSRVKSEEKIDTALVEYLKTKIDRADLILKEK